MWEGELEGRGGERRGRKGVKAKVAIGVGWGKVSEKAKIQKKGKSTFPTWANSILVLLSAQSLVPDLAQYQPHKEKLCCSDLSSCKRSALAREGWTWGTAKPRDLKIIYFKAAASPLRFLTPVPPSGAGKEQSLQPM